MPPASAALFPFFTFGKIYCGSCGGSLGMMAVSVTARLPVGVAGLSEWRLLPTLRLVDLIEFSGRACLYHLKGRRSACGAAGCWRVLVR
jgi:hypothetical protein